MLPTLTGSVARRDPRPPKRHALPPLGRFRHFVNVQVIGLRSRRATESLRVLHEIGDAGFTAAVRAEVAAESTAVEQSELGDLSGRARQAVVLTRADASLLQVTAADRLLEADPLGDDSGDDQFVTVPAHPHLLADHLMLHRVAHLVHPDRGLLVVHRPGLAEHRGERPLGHQVQLVTFLAEHPPVPGGSRGGSGH